MYEELDKQIVAAVASGANRFYQICDIVKAREDRTVDRRLQALRKRGSVTFKSHSGWKVPQSRSTE